MSKHKRNIRRILHVVKSSIIIVIVVFSMSLCKSSERVSIIETYQVTYDTTFIGNDTIVSVQHMEQGKQSEKTQMWVLIGATLLLVIFQIIRL